MDAHVLAVGAGAPSFRLSAQSVAEAWGGRGRGVVGVCAPDEDALTLSWSAATDALEAAGLTPEAVDALWWGVPRPPFADGPSHAYLTTALRLRDDVGGAVLGGSAHAGMDALFAAWDAVAAGSAQTVLVVAADDVRPATGTTLESRAGAGAVAYLISASPGAATLRRRQSRVRPVLDRYRGEDDACFHDTYDGRLFREQVFLPGVAELGTALADGAQVRAWSLPDPDGRLGATVAKRLGADASASAGVYERLGDTGAAAALLGLVGALEEPGTAAAIAYGGGRFSGLTAEVREPVPGVAAALAKLDRGLEVSYPKALRARGQLLAGNEPIPMGVPPGSAMFVRAGVELLALHGSRCVDCGAISTPPSVHPACVGCGGSKLEETPLARTGTVQTFIINQAMPAPFVAPLPLLIVDLDDGARIQVQATDEDDGEGLGIGDRVTLVLRRYAVERGASIYGYKTLRQQEA